MDIVLEALTLGMEVNLDGRTYVWLDDYPTQVINGVQYGINGLAIKCEAIHFGGEKEPEAHYIGAPLGLKEFMEYCNDLPEDYLLELAANVVLNQTKRKGRG